MNRNDVCFRQWRSVDPIVMVGVQCEGNRTFFLSDDENRYSGMPITIESVRFSVDRCETGDVWVKVLHSGPLTVRSCVMDGPMGRRVIPIQFGPKNHPELHTQSACIIEANQWRTDVPAEEAIQFPNETTPHGLFIPDKFIFGNKTERSDGFYKVQNIIT